MPSYIVRPSSPGQGESLMGVSSFGRDDTYFGRQSIVYAMTPEEARVEGAKRLSLNPDRVTVELLPE